jgi:3-oxoadipate enol-lactonase/4-carboxymuconolactone decarboxylase
VTGTPPHFLADGPAGAPPLLLGPSLGTTHAVWQAQVPALAQHFRVIRWDLPGHGGTPAEAFGAEHTVERLAHLVLTLADTLGIDRFRYAGVSLGGAVGALLAARHPERIEALALVCTSARFGPPDGWRERAGLVRAEGTGPVADAAATRWFTPGFATDPAARALVRTLRDDVDPAGYAACCEALAEYDLRAELDRITAPTLVVAGRRDLPTPPGHARELADGIPGAGLVELAGAAHLAPVERSRPVTAALLDHFPAGEADDVAPGGVRAGAPAARPDDGPDGSRADGPDGSRTGPTAGEPDDRAPTDDAGRRAAGTAVRRAVLGDAHVDRAVARTSAFTAPFQDFITRYAWGEVWTRPGLSRHTRSCLTLTALVARGHHEELAMHVRAALRNGLTPDDIAEVLLHTAVYCGVPAANAAFAIAERVLTEEPPAP